MGFQKGHKKLGGRKKGSVTKDRQALLERANDLGVDVFEILLRFANNDWKGLGYNSPDRISPELRVKAASEACVFMLPRLKAIDVVDKSEFQPEIIYVAQWGSKMEQQGDDHEGS